MPRSYRCEIALNVTLPFCLAMTLGLALYGPCLGSFFLADDFLWLRPLSFREVLGFLFQSWGHGQAYRPVMRLDYFFDFALFGAEPLGWHIKNVVIHSLNALVLWHIVYTLSQSKRWSYAVLTLFAVSPLVHENVAWISGRTYLLGAFFMFLSLLLLIRSAQNKAVLKLDFIASCCFYTIGIVTYEAVVSLPFLAGLFAVRQYFISKPQNLKTSKPQNLNASLVVKVFLLFVLTGVIWIARRLVLGDFVGGVNTHHENLWHGLQYNLPIVVDLVSTAFYEFWVLVVCVVLLAIHSLVSKRSQVAFDLILIVFIALVAYLPFLIVIGVADRFLYLVAAAYAVLVVFSMSYLHRFGKAYQALCAGIFLVLLVSHSFTTASRVAEWQEAGAIVYNTSKEFYRLFPDATHSDRFVFHQLPSHHGKAILFLTNVEKSMAWWHEEFKGQIYQSTDKFDPVKTKDEARHLVYNEGIGNIQLVH